MSEGRGTILVVDDDSVLRRLLATVLKLRGFDVLVAEDGVQALEVLQHEDHVDLVLADIIMPQMDGWTLLERLREHHPSVPVILLTLIEEAKPTSLRAEEMGAAACLFKPIDPVSLMSGVDRVLGAA
ncbi:MAG: response regulator [Myxococcota bacterium]|nr:response regulator [Myxococcota bacterium]